MENTHPMEIILPLIVSPKLVLATSAALYGRNGTDALTTVWHEQATHQAKAQGFDPNELMDNLSLDWGAEGVMNFSVPAYILAQVGNILREMMDDPILEEEAQSAGRILLAGWSPHFQTALDYVRKMESGEIDPDLGIHTSMN